MKIIHSVLFLTLLAACTSHEPPQATGPWHQLNPGRWSFNENMLTQPPPGLER
jgi:hypothetical protein